MSLEPFTFKHMTCPWLAGLQRHAASMQRHRADCAQLDAHMDTRYRPQSDKTENCSTALNNCTAYLDGPLRNDDIILLWVPHGELLPHFVDAVDPGGVLPLRNRMLLQQLVDACTGQL